MADSGAGGAEPQTKQPRSVVPRKKYALVFGYNGLGYFGMQRQLGGSEVESRCPTIEGELEKALSTIGAFTPGQAVDWTRIQWSRVGRTDKGVHAVCQVVTAKLTLGPNAEADVELKRRARDDEPLTPEQLLLADSLQRRRELAFLAKLREALPPAFEIFDITRVPNNFDARHNCQERQYEYCFPSHILRRASLRDNSAEILDFFTKYGAGKVVLGDQENSAGLPRVELMPFSEKQTLFGAVQEPERLAAAWELAQGDLGALALKYRTELSWLRKVFSMLTLTERLECWEHFHHGPPPTCAADQCPYGPLELLSVYQEPLPESERQTFRLSDEDFERCEKVLQRYLGHHHWFNFTSRISDKDATGGRKLNAISLYRAYTDPTSQGEILVVRLRGVSFLLNQIRKMVSAVIETMIGTAPFGAISYLLQPPLSPKKHLHLAPAEGLLLERAFMETKNRTSGQQIANIDYAHDFESANPHGPKMTRLLDEGVYEVAPQPIAPCNPLMDGGAKRQRLGPEEPTWVKFDWFDSPDEDDKPVWFRVLQFKHRKLVPMTLKLFRENKVLVPFINDILWHPFFAENYPTPVAKHVVHKSTGAEDEPEAKAVKTD